jgi:hypothetical protein
MELSEIEGVDRPLDDGPDEEIALALEGVKDEARETTEAVTSALLNEDRPLTDEDVERLWQAGNALAALSRTLTGRVPPVEENSSEE